MCRRGVWCKIALIKVVIRFTMIVKIVSTVVSSLSQHMIK
jgi:hypothetical protein